MLKGHGYDIHQDCDVEITDTYKWTPQKETKRYEWEAGDVIYMPPNTKYQTSAFQCQSGSAGARDLCYQSYFQIQRPE